MRQDHFGRTFQREDSMMSSRSTPTRQGVVLSAIGWRRAIGMWAAETVKLVRSYAGKIGRWRSGASGPNACQPLTRAADDASLLACRMAALDLDSYELAITEAALVHHLQRRCLACEDWRRCLQDLDRVGSVGRDRQDWMNYCPNASALKMLSALQNRTGIAPANTFPYLG
jgi:hypothetical protein